MSPSLPVFVGLDYSQCDVQLCVLDPHGKVLCNQPVDNSAVALEATVRRFGIVKGAAFEACTGAANLAQNWPTASPGPFIWLTPDSSLA